MKREDRRKRVSKMEDEVQCCSSLPCFHRGFMLDKCVSCGSSKSECGDPATIPFHYIDPGLSLTDEGIRVFRNDNLLKLLISKKLHLILDLDHTLIHARKIKKLKSKDRQSINSINDAFEFALPDGEYVMKLRPGARDFIHQLCSMFELSVFTKGTRAYANQIVERLGGRSKFSWVITREDCLKESRKTLDVVLSHEQVVLIVDDTVRVWEESCRANLIQIKGYDFFPLKEGKDEMDKELTRVFDVLWLVHNIFYDKSFAFENDDGIYGTRDIREVLQLISPNSFLDGLSQGLCFLGHQEQKPVESHEETKGSATVSRKRLRSDEEACLRNTTGVQEKRCKKLVIKFNGTSSTIGEKISRSDKNNVGDSFQQNAACEPAKRCIKLRIKFPSSVH